VAAQGNGPPDGWRRSPYSNNGGNCVEVAVWHGRNCIEVSFTDRQEIPAAHKTDAGKLFVLRDSKDPDGPRLYFTETEWDAFARGMKDGAFDDLG
jgi:Domain of unknown function (DUF397)